MKLPAAGLPMSRGAHAVAGILSERSCRNGKKNHIRMESICILPQIITEPAHICKKKKKSISLHTYTYRSISGGLLVSHHPASVTMTTWFQIAWK